MNALGDQTVQWWRKRTVKVWSQSDGQKVLLTLESFPVPERAGKRASGSWASALP